MNYDIYLIHFHKKNWNLYLIDMRSALYVMPYNIKKVFSFFLDVT